MMHQYYGQKPGEHPQGDRPHLPYNHQHETVIKGEIGSWHRNQGGTDNYGSAVWPNLGACLAPFGFLLFGAGITVLVVQDGMGYATGIPIAVLGIVLFFAGLLAASSCIMRREAKNVSECII